MTGFKILGTTIKQTLREPVSTHRVEIVFADGDDFEAAETAVHFHTTWEAAAQSSPLPELQAKALLHVRDALDGEIARLQALAGPTL